MNNNDSIKKYNLNVTMLCYLILAVKKVDPQMKIASYQIDKNGYSFDFDLSKSIDSDELGVIQSEMKSLLSINTIIEIVSVNNSEAKKILHSEPYQLELLESFNGNIPIKICKVNDMHFICEIEFEPISDLSKFDKEGVKLLHVSGAYWKGDASRTMLQRIYGVAFESKSELDEYIQNIEDIKKRDHRTLGSQLHIFSTSDSVGQGLVLWEPKGAMIRFLLEKFSQTAHLLNDYDWVYTPHIGRAELWETSGHLNFYKDSMYNAINVDGEDYYLKPMSCPFHILIYEQSPKSYRELPIRYAEFATVYRYELSGALQGLTRVRGFTQDDAHIFCTPEQIYNEVVRALEFSLYILKSFGLNDFKAYVSTKPTAKYIGNDEDWSSATEVLKNAVSECGLEYGIDEGGGAFYGPKIDLKLYDSLGREWQCSTIQLDFNLPERFNMTYTGSDGNEHTPMMVHRALFGSVERFVAMLIEHYNGDFPLWFSPIQLGIIPVTERSSKYAGEIEDSLRSLGLRVKTDYNSSKMGAKIRQMTLEKIPYILILGDKEETDKTISVRERKQGNIGTFTLSEFMDLLKPELEKGIPKYIKTISKN